MKVFADAYPAAYQTLYEAKSVTCSVTGTSFDAVPAPCAVILDVSLLSGISTTHRPFLLLLLPVLCPCSITCY
jgi:hypothetical protein